MGLRFDDDDTEFISRILRIFIIATITFLTMVAVGWSDEVEIAHWNIRSLSDASRDDAELTQIAEIIQRYDFIAISELRDTRVLERLQTILRKRGFDYNAQVSPQIGKAGISYKERHAFLYNSDFQLLRSGKLVHDPQDKFVRDPFWADFKVGNFDFSIIVSHVTWGRRIVDRQAEVQALADVYNRVQLLNGSEQDVLLVGDFNRNPNDRRAWNRLLAIPSMQMLFQLPLKSYIKDTSLYDNILFQQRHLSEYLGESGIYKFDEIMFDNNDREANLAVSDHRPVWARFFTGFKDDD